MSTAALLYCVAAIPPFLSQLCLMFGAPWAHLTMGGKWNGALPPRIRPLAALQALLLLCLMSVALDAGGVRSFGWPDWSIWPALALTYLTTLGNLATPSRWERLLWGPLTLIMSGALSWIAFL